MLTRVVAAAAVAALVSADDDGLAYYTRENCEKLGLLPNWSDPDYAPSTSFEKIFRTPLTIDLLASAHSGNATGFEQVTADWGCAYDICYGTGCKGEGLYGPGAKDPAGGGCPRGPVRVYEDLTCAIKLGLAKDPEAFTQFCDGSGDINEGTFECLAFFANVITETGAFSQLEEKDPRPYCWDRSGSGDCCPAADHQPCLPDSDQELPINQYPTPTDRWLTDKPVESKCCSYHGRGPLQVSYEPNYKALSEAMLGDGSVLLNYPYKLDADGVAGWTSALWFWFNKHPAQVGNKDDPNGLIEAAPRDRVLDWRHNGGLPGAINIINGAECTGDQGTQRAFSRVSYFYAIARRLNAKPPGKSTKEYYALPGTADCEEEEFCSAQYKANSDSECVIFKGGVDCSSTPYVANISTPMGFNRVAVKLTQIDGQTPVCIAGFTSASQPQVWAKDQEDFVPIPQWEKMLDVHMNNVCDYAQLVYSPDDGENWCVGKSENCNRICWSEQSPWGYDQPCQEGEYQKPCPAMAAYVSHPMPATNYESGNMTDYAGGIYYGRVGPGLVMAMNGAMGLGDKQDRLCYWYGASRCHWNIAMPDNAGVDADVHGCKIFPPGTTDDVLRWVDPATDEGGSDSGDFEQLEPGQFPQKLENVLSYWDRKNCPNKTGRTIVEKLLPKGFMDFDMLLSATYSAADGFDNAYFDKFDNKNVNVNQLGLGPMGPVIAYDEFLCALELGIPSDPDIFMKRFGLSEDAKNVEDVPETLTEEQRRFASMEFAAFFANVIKETGALGQAEEQFPTKYCNDQGGAENQCCPNEWGNNPPCYTTTTPDNTTIPPDEMRRALGTNATCCTYHGRGYLQVSYERNYGDIGSVMLVSSDDGVDADLGRKFGVNFPQFIDAFGITGWVSSLLFWLDPRPCQYCGGRNTTTQDWNSPTFSPHTAIQDWTTPGQGLGMTFTIINGNECEAGFTMESKTSLLGAHDRLAFFYNLVYRLNVGPPGEDLPYYPLPGTVECTESPWCKGTFDPVDPPVASYRPYSGGCWALTAQPAEKDGEWYTPYCTPHRIRGGTKLGSRLDVVSFTMYKPDPKRCETLGERFCGVKKIRRGSEVSMTENPDLKIFTEWSSPALDDLQLNYIGVPAAQICQYVTNEPDSLIPVLPYTCMFWCQHSSGALGYCTTVDNDCYIQKMNVPFINCANKFLKQSLKWHAGTCTVPRFDGPLPVPPPIDYDDGSSETGCPKGCTSCGASSGKGYDDEHCKKCANGAALTEWPCHTTGYCVCTDPNFVPEE